MLTLEASLDELRAQFPALRRQMPDGRPLLFLDGPAGTQVPQTVIDAIGEYLIQRNANRHGAFLTAIETEGMFATAQQRFAEFIGVTDPNEIVFGPNMTSLTFQISRALAQTWQPGDEIIVTRLDHDANVSPWVLAARDRDVTVRWVGFLPGTLHLDLESLAEQLSPRTRLVACGAASNSSGGLNPVKQIVDIVHSVGALAYIDAVHLGPHRQIQAADWGADFVVCSAYKFFGPHVGILWGRRQLLEQVAAYKVRPASNAVPEKWMQGTQNHEGIAGAAACVDYLQRWGSRWGHIPLEHRSQCLTAAFAAIEAYETQLTHQFLDGLTNLPNFQLIGVGSPANTTTENSSDQNRAQNPATAAHWSTSAGQRVSTFSLRHQTRTATSLAEALAAQGICCWNGHYYALELSEQLGFEPEGMLRIGFVHYNTPAEVEQLLAALADLH
jgi:cysteine desulfurase family protein (TIGR01976 family)